VLKSLSIKREYSADFMLPKKYLVTSLKDCQEAFFEKI